MPENFNYLSLFSGIPLGGLDLGLDRAGMTCVGQVEKDEFCQRVLARHWPEVPRHDDVRTAPAWWMGTARPAVDLVAGGFPCQPFSIAGRRAGVADERWGWPWFAAVVRVVRPRYVLVENVAALLRDADAFGIILTDLAALGYDAEWDCVPAAAVGAPHRRDRLFLVAHAGGDLVRDEPVAEPRRGGTAIAGDDGADGHVADTDEERRRGRPRVFRPVGWAEPAHGGGYVADSPRHGRGEGWPRRPAGDGPHRAAIPAPELADTHRNPPVWAPVARPERDPRPVKSGLGGSLDGVSAWLDGSWEDGIARTALGVPDRTDRLRALGNAVVPQVAEHVGRLILAHARAVAV